MNQQLRTTRLGAAPLFAVLALVAAACSTATTTTSGPPEDTLVLCSDGIDNDGNGMVDCGDAACATSTDKKIQSYCAKGDTFITDVKKDADTGSDNGAGTDTDATDQDQTSPGDADADVASTTCPLAGQFGCPCKTANDCDSGYCIDGDQGKVCTKTCSDSCPTDWLCKQTTGTDAAWICLPAYPTLCMPCATSDECQINGMTGSYCVPFVRVDSGEGHGFIDGSFCLAGCVPGKDGADTCKAGYHCQELKLNADAKPVKQCVPDTNDCGCHDDWAQAGKSTVCSKSSVAGVCVSKRQCGFNAATGQTVLSVCNAAEPVTETCGDNADNDCNGLTDEPGAAGCKSWYLDNDGDTFGIGLGLCQCNNPGAGYGNNGGDCNDLAASIHPGAVEICNNIDDNCNGTTDESGSKGCTVFFHDLDGDGWGNPNDSACLCKSKQTSDWISQGADCDDTPGSGAKVHPGVDEVCDGIDNNCDGKIDDQGAKGCQLYYVDADNDTYGVLSTGMCLCAATKANSAGQPGDCDDGNGTVNPGAQEICDDVDNDCNAKVDDGSADATCGAIAGGSSKCVNGACGVGTCAKGFYDVNGDPSDGCECVSVQSVGNMGTFCGNAIDVGVLPDGSATIQKAGQILPGEAGDWYKFNATDNPDVGSSATGNCDQYAVHISFVLNPGNLFVFDVYRGSCGTADQVCAAETAHDWSTSFYGPMSPFGPKNKANANILGTYQKSPYPEVAGECNCVPANAKLKPCAPTPTPPGGTLQYDNPQDDPLLSGCGPQGLPGMNICSDNSSWYYVRVFTKPGVALTCDQYIIKFDNSSSANTAPPQN